MQWCRLQEKRREDKSEVGGSMKTEQGLNDLHCHAIQLGRAKESPCNRLKDSGSANDGISELIQALQFYHAEDEGQELNFCAIERTVARVASHAFRFIWPCFFT